MTGPVNVYALSRIRDEEAFNIVKRHQSRDNDKRYTQLHEMGSLRLLVDALVKEGVGVWELDSFFFGYNISRIGKEFDLLRVTDKYCLNIELKSMEVPKSQILDQLRKNRYYLNLLGKRQELFTVVTSDKNIEEQGETIQKAVNAMAKALRWMETATPEEIAEKLAPLFEAAPEELLFDATYDKEHEMANYTGYHSDSGFAAGISLCQLAGGIPADYNPDAAEIFDESFLDNAWAALGD